jgi:hypothetical protein
MTILFKAKASGHIPHNFIIHNDASMTIQRRLSWIVWSFKNNYFVKTLRANSMITIEMSEERKR